ncbi:TetR/AcrR family transcriptional regulator [Janibacter sp. GS2]|uniref:TetR/AcrR family transcriptional regulator n=1 Tax=Janibacter sp. GS2 TaxID=3442646 RepID=UPI003EB9C042
MGEVGTKGVARAERRQQLVDEAVEEFGRRGYARASLADIARRAGVSKAMIHHVFTSKEGLGAACLEEVGPGLVAAIAAAQTADDPGQRAQDTITAIFAAMAEHRHAWAVIHDDTLPPGSAALGLAAGFRSQLHAMGTIGTREVLSAAGVDDPVDHDLLDRLWEAIVAAAVQWWQEHDEMSAADMAERFTRLLAVITARR